MRALDYLRMAFGDMVGRPMRTFLTLFALAISAGVLALLGAMAAGGQQALVSQFGTANDLSFLTVTTNQSAAGLSPYGGAQQTGGHTKLTDDDVTQLAQLPHVIADMPRAQIWELATMSYNGASFVAKAQGVPAAGAPMLSAGRTFADDNERNAVILGYDYAKSLGFGDNPGKLIGKTITFTTQKGYRGSGASIPPATSGAAQNQAFSQQVTTLNATVIGVSKPGPDQGSAFVSMGWARAIRTLNYYDGGGNPASTDQLAKDGYSAIQIKADSTASIAELEKTLKASGYGVTSPLQYITSIRQIAGIAGIILAMVAIVALMASILGVANTMIMSVTDRRYEIGILRACGARKRVIVWLILVQAAILGLIGAVIGVLLSLPLEGVINGYASALLSQQGLQTVAIAQITPGLAGVTLGVTIFFSLLAGLYPAYRAAGTDPSKVLRAN